MKLAALAVLMSSCAWSDAIVHDGDATRPRAPCVRLVRPGRNHYEVYKGDRLVGTNPNASTELAVADRPASLELLHRSARFNTAAEVVAAAFAIAIGTLVVGINRDNAELMVAGGGLTFASLGTGLALSVHSEALEHEAIDDYNADAAIHGCPRE